MASGGFKCTLEVTLDVVSSPGVRLPIRDDLYLTVEVFGQAKRTRLLDPTFPLRVHERFQFERHFWTAEDAYAVADLLAEAPVTLELRQVGDIYLGGCLLAYHESNCRDFFSLLACRPSHSANRDLLLTRTVDFPGVPPRLEFATYAAIEELLPGGGLLATNSGDALAGTKTGGRRSRSRSRSRRSGTINGTTVGGGGGGSNNYERQTLAAAMRSRSPSPRLKALCDDLDEPSTRTAKSAAAAEGANGRPPFVVRRVENSLVGRTPAMHDNFASAARRHRPRSASGGPPGESGKLRRSRSSTDLRRRQQQQQQPLGDTGAGARYRSPSPGSRLSLAERYPSLTAAGLHERVADTLRRSGSPYRYYRPYYPYYSYYYPYYYPYYYGRYYDDLELLESEMRRSRLRSLRA